MNRVLFSTSPDAYNLATDELRRCFGAVPIARLGPDIGIADVGPVGRVADECRRRPIVFIQHLAQLTACLDGSSLADVASAATAAVRTDRIAVQAWISGPNRWGYGSGDVTSAIEARLRERDIAVFRAGEEHTLSVCLTPRAVLVGVNRTSSSIADWPGGRVRLSRRPEQVSRAEFKLEELLAAVPLDLSGVAVDYGAAPGGWTRILRGYGLRVIAVDPGDLHPLVSADPGVTHLRTTAGEFLRSHRRNIDLAVNDMRMDPALSTRLMVRTGAILRPGGHAVITLKTGFDRAVDTLDRCLQALSGPYRVLLARQLHHNRREVTVLLRRR